MVNELKAIFNLQHLLKATGLAKSVYYYHCKVLRLTAPDEALQSQIAQLYHELPQDNHVVAVIGDEH